MPRLNRTSRRHVKSNSSTLARRSLRYEALEPRQLFTVSTAAGDDYAALLSHGGTCPCPVCSGIFDEIPVAQSSDGQLAASNPLSSLPTLHSNPTATAKLFLDFNGHFQSSWGSWSNATTPVYDQDGDATTFSDGELASVQEIWARVSEDYAPFNIDVTTVDPGSLANRVVAHIAIGGSSSDWYGSSAGGVAYIGGFYNSAPNVGYVFENNLGNGHAKYVAEAATHEAGHLFGLQHQSVWSGSTLVQPYNSGNAEWAPHMGNGYSSVRTTWHNGTSSVSPSSFQDDLSIISNNSNAFGYKADDFGSTVATASALPAMGTSINFSGLIGRYNDVDVWSFTTTGGSFSMQLAGAAVGTNLDAVLELWNSSGFVVLTSSPNDSLGASFSTTVGAGTFYLVARSLGDYGDMGQYTLTGSLPAASQVPEIDLNVSSIALSDGSTLSFGTTTPGIAVARTVTVVNQGTATLTLTSLDAGALPTGFTLLSTLGSTSLAAGQSTTFTIRLDATALGTFGGPIQLFSNDGNESPYDLVLSGTVSAAEISITQGGIELIDGQTLDFGSAAIGNPVTRTLTIVNDGNDTLALTAIDPLSLPTGFSLLANLASTTLAAGESTSFSLQFNAAVAGTFGGSLAITNNDSNENPFDLTLLGRVSPLSSSATFVGSDTTTQGNWQSSYGSDGYNLSQGAVNLPAYAQVTLSGQSNYTWAASTSDPRALQKPGASDRLAATWYAGSSFTVDLNLTGNQTHQVALYLLDWDHYLGGRSERLDVLDASTGQVLDTRTVSSFGNGQYLTWTLGGHVQIRVTSLAGNAVLSGIFFGGSATPTSSATFVGSDTTTQGNWESLYGSDGYHLSQGAVNLPAYAQVTFSGQSNYTWAASTSDPRALQKPGASDRLAATWYAGSSFTVDLNLTGNQTHQVALYLLDWDHYLGGRSERLDVLDASTGQVLDTRTVSSFGNGQYLTWTLGGHVQIRVTSLAGNAVLSGIFFGGSATPPTSSATFVGSDTTTQGNWQSSYGSDGYHLSQGAVNLPAYAQVTLSGQSNYTWAASTSDPRALQKPGVSDRLAATWYAGSSFTVDLNLTGNQTHQVALYLLDWDHYGPRSERLDVLDASTGQVLDTRTVSSFGNGQYLTWTLGGHVQIRVTSLAGNAVLSGIFFGGSATPPSSVATFVGSDTTTQGNWQSLYGSDGYNLSQGAVNLPAYAQVTFSGQSDYTWAASTSDPRALQKPGVSDRLAATWYTGSSFTVDLNLTGNQTHQVALYLLDWDHYGPRSERLDVLDASTGQVLDTRTVSSFGNGQYLTWTLGGHVQIRVTNLTGGNAVLSGIFFGGTNASTLAVSQLATSNSIGTFGGLRNENPAPTSPVAAAIVSALSLSDAVRQDASLEQPLRALDKPLFSGWQRNLNDAALEAFLEDLAPPRGEVIGRACANYVASIPNRPIYFARPA